MKLERLYIQGFKSFKDRTTIQFDDGITGIVGPNGCGKSNIVDALFWVMGEQSAKHLRGSKMSDLIFSGSKKYSPASFAEVTLVLLNDDKKHIHIGSKVVCPSEIQLTRKLYKSGDTEYKINNMPARLKDIQEVFMDTGAGAKSYSIIAQGEIDRLVKAKPVERRVMIEEVAGITKFKARKKESIRKIDQTTTNLERINDLKKEIHKNLKSLESQAEKAEKAKSLKEKIRRHSLIVDSSKELDFLEKINEYSTTIKLLNQTVEDSQIELDNVSLSLENEKNQQSILTDEIESLQFQFNEGSMELVSFEEKLNFSKTSLEEKKRYIEEKNNEIENIQLDLEDNTRKVEEIELALSNFEESFSSDSGDGIAEQEEEVQELKEQLQNQEERKQEVETKFSDLRTQITNLENEQIKIESARESKSTSLEIMTQEIEDLENYYLEVNSGDSLKRQDLSKLETEYDGAFSNFQNAQSHVSNITEELKALRDEKSQQSHKKTKALTQKESLEENLAQYSMHGFLEKFADQGFMTLKDMIEVKDASYQKGVTSLLAPYFHAVIGPDHLYSDVESWAKESENQVKILCAHEAIDSFAPVGYKSLSEIVHTESEVVKNFLSFFLISESVASLDDMSLDLKGSSFLAIGDLQGDKIVSSFGANFLLNVNSNMNSNDFLSLKDKLSRIQDELIELDKFSSEIEERIELKNEALEVAESQRVGLKAVYDQLNERRISAKAQLNSESHQFKINEDRLGSLKKKSRTLSEERFSLVERDEVIVKQLEDLRVEFDDLTNLNEDEADKFTELSSLYSQKLETYLELKSEFKSFESRKESFQRDLVDLGKQRERNQERLKTYESSIEENKEAIETILLNEEEYSHRINEMAELLKVQEDKLSELKDDLAQILVGMQDRDASASKLRSIINKSEKEIVEKQVKVEKMIEEEEILVRNNFDQFRIDLRSIISEHLSLNLEGELRDLSDMFYIETDQGATRVESEAYEFQKKFPGQIKESNEKLKNYKSQYNRLGSINWQAVEDYEKQKVRYDFLKSQEDELNKSIEDLMSAINHIDEKSRERFQVAYEEVNSKFTQVFPIIFGGGSATLKMVGDLNTDDFGVEIVASPPGKRMQNINLMSGGEKALTAVALIFSIFLVKPSPFCLLDEVDAPLDDANVGRFNQLLREMSHESQFILITHNKKTMELNDRLYGITMQEPGVSKALSVQLH